MKEKLLNKATIVGRVYGFGRKDGKRKLEIKTVSREDSPNYGKPFINGIINIAIDEDGTHLIPVEYVYVSPVFGNGKVNTSFNILKDIIEQDLTWESRGKDGAAMVMLTPSIMTNDYIDPTSGEPARSAVLQGGFVNRIASLDGYKDRNKFVADAIFSSINRREFEDGTSYGVVTACVFDSYRKTMQPVDFKIYDEAGVSFFEDMLASGPLGAVAEGYIDFFSTTEEKAVESDWGGPSIRTVSRSKKDWVIERTTQSYEVSDESPIAMNDLVKAKADREIHLAEVKKNWEDWNNQPKTPVASSPAAVAGNIPVGGFVI